MALARQRQAKLLCFHHAACAARRKAPPQRLGDLVGCAFLQRQALGETLDQIGEPAESCQLARGNVRHVRKPAKRNQVVRTHRVKAQAADDDHIGIFFSDDRIAQDGRRIHGVAG